MVTEDSDRMFYKMEKKEQTLSEMLQEGFEKEREEDKTYE